ncbi:MAG: hypothetical protein CMQ43_10215 [Gammaproteobacteria bacterium]|nr:hypothetical protein [Gammaproteobacteria bacterium]
MNNQDPTPVNTIRRASLVLAWALSALLPAIPVTLTLLPADSYAAAAPRAPATRPATTRSSASARRPDSRASRYVARVTPRATRANADARARRQASGASATAPAAGRRNGVRLGAPPFARWSAWNRAAGPVTAPPARAQRERQSRSGMRVRFRTQAPQPRR